MPYKNPEDKKAHNHQRYLRKYESERSRLDHNKKLAQKRNYDYINDLKSSTPCADCNGQFPAICMDFDHISEDKIATIAQMAKYPRSLEHIREEIDKCEIVCSNCHRIRTLSRGDYTKVRDRT